VCAALCVHCTAVCSTAQHAGQGSEREGQQMVSSLVVLYKSMEESSVAKFLCWRLCIVNLIVVF